MAILGWIDSCWLNLVALAGIARSVFSYLSKVMGTASRGNRHDLFLESYGPIILKHQAQRRRNAGVRDVYAPIELQKLDWKKKLESLVLRPIVLFADPIVFCCCTYLAFEYAIFYLFFEAYPIVFGGENVSSPECDLLIQHRHVPHQLCDFYLDLHTRYDVASNHWLEQTCLLISRDWSYHSLRHLTLV